MNTPSFHHIQAFVKVVEHQSFAMAARELQMTASSVSRLVKALELELGTTLITRTTRAMSLTELGQRYYDQCAQALEQLRLANAQLSERNATPRGTLKLCIPVSFGRSHVLPHLAAFLLNYPDIQLDLVMSDQYVDIVAEAVTLAIRIGQLEDSSLVARKMLDNRRVLVASPAYLKAHGTPLHIEQLKEHHCLVLSINRDGEQWRLIGANGERSFRPRGRLRANNGDAVKQLTMDGLGIAFLSRVTVQAALDSGDLIQILPEWQGRESGVYGVCATRPMPMTALALIEFLQNRWT
jgi:DNA-binding transcriptional LysR family regulator